MKTAALLLTVLISSSLFAQKAVLIEDGDTQEEIGFNKSLFQTRQKQHPEKTSKSEFFSSFDLRAKRRVGVGLSVAGQLGLLGAFAELNFGVENSTIFGYGTGGSYNSLTLQWKHVFNSQKLTPYVTLGYSRWFSNGQNGSPTQATPSFLSQKLLSDYEKQTGKFGKDLLIPSAGLQYYLLNGPYVGSSLYAEVMMLFSPQAVDSVANGSMGMIYYF